MNIKKLVWMIVFVLVICNVYAQEEISYSEVQDNPELISGLSDEQLIDMVEKNPSMANEYVNKFNSEQLNKIADKLNSDSILERRNDIKDISKLNQDELNKAWQKENPGVELDVEGKGIKWGEDNILTSGNDKQDMSKVQGEVIGVNVDESGKITLITKENVEIEISGNGVKYNPDTKEYTSGISPVKIRGAVENSIRINGKEIYTAEDGEVEFVKTNQYKSTGKVRIYDTETKTNFISNEGTKIINYGSTAEAGENEINIALQQDGTYDISSKVDCDIEFYDKVEENLMKLGTIRFKDDKVELPNKDFLLSRFEGKAVVANDLEIKKDGTITYKGEVISEAISTIERKMSALRQRSLENKQRLLGLDKEDMITLAKMRGFDIDESTPDEVLREYTLGVNTDKYEESGISFEDYLDIKNSVLNEYSKTQHLVDKAVEDMLGKVAVETKEDKAISIIVDGEKYLPDKDGNFLIQGREFTQDDLAKDGKTEIATSLAKLQTTLDYAEQREKTEKVLVELLGAEKNADGDYVFTSEFENENGEVINTVTKKVDDLLGYQKIYGIKNQEAAKQQDAFISDSQTIKDMGVTKDNLVDYNKYGELWKLAYESTNEEEFKIKDTNGKLIDLAFLSSHGTDKGISFIYDDGTRVNYDLDKSTGEFKITDDTSNKRRIYIKDQAINNIMKSSDLKNMPFEAWTTAPSEVKSSMTSLMLNMMADAEGESELNLAEEFKNKNIETKLEGSEILAYFQREDASNEYGSMLRFHSDDSDVVAAEVKRTKDQRGLTYLDNLGKETTTIEEETSISFNNGDIVQTEDTTIIQGDGLSYWDTLLENYDTAEVTLSINDKPKAIVSEENAEVIDVLEENNDVEVKVEVKEEPKIPEENKENVKFEATYDGGEVSGKTDVDSTQNKKQQIQEKVKTLTKEETVKVNDVQPSGSSGTSVVQTPNDEVLVKYTVPGWAGQLKLVNKLIPKLQEKFPYQTFGMFGQEKKNIVLALRDIASEKDSWLGINWDKIYKPEATSFKIEISDNSAQAIYTLKNKRTIIEKDIPIESARNYQKFHNEWVDI